jgi:hypothetical protein
MKLLFLIMSCVSAVHLYAQKSVDVTTGNASAMAPNFFTVVNGEPIVFAKFTQLVSGSPYFRDEWMKGNVVMNGAEKQYAGILLKLDLYQNEVHYQSLSGIEMIAITPIQKVVLFDTVAEQIFNFVNGQFIEASSPVRGWYILLAEGNATLFKQIRKHLTENKPYGSATVEQSISNTVHYYILYKGNFTEVKKIRDLPDLLADKKSETSDYLKNKNVSGKNESDFEDVINYFNSLH